jgi:hypothetical protein
MASKPQTAKVPSKQAIIRAVASSTAIETGKSVRLIEKQLRNKKSKFRALALAR